MDTRDYYVRAFNEFAQAAESEIRAYKLGAMFWQANQELEMSKSQRDMAFEDAAQALAKNKILFLQMGMKADDVQIKLIADELEALNKLKSSFETK